MCSVVLVGFRLSNASLHLHYIVLYILSSTHVLLILARRGLFGGYPYYHKSINKNKIK